MLQDDKRAGDAGDMSLAVGDERRFAGGDDKRFVGRERERELFRAVLGDLVAGRGEVVFVAGEPGIGKTRLLTEYARLCREAGIPVAWGRASESGGAPALWPWQEILRELMRRVGRERFTAAAGPGLPFIARLVPGIMEPGAGSEIESSGMRFQLFDAVTRLVAELAPVALILDDLHAADLATLLLLEHAAPSLARARVLLVGSFRPEDVERTPEVAKILWRVVREATHLPLGRLAEAEAQRLLEAVLGRPASADERRLVVRATEGSPLFVQEYARLLRARGEVPPTLPPVVRHALEARVERMPGPTREALATLSVVGRELDARVVAALGVPAAALEPAVQAGLLLELGAGWSYSHILLRDALYQRLGHEARATLHERAGDALSALGHPAVEVAHHHLLAGERIDEARFVATVVAAIGELVRVLAFDDAANLAQRALAARRLSERACGELLAHLGSARVRGGNVEDGRRMCGEAAEIARRLGDDVLFARAALFAGVDFTPGEVDPQLVALLERAAALELGDHALTARVKARLAAAWQPAREPPVPMRVAHEAIAMAREVSDPALMLEVLAGATSALAYFEEPSIRAPLDAELLALAERSGDRVLAMRALMRLCYDEIDRGQRVAAEAHLEACERLCEALGQARFTWHVKLVRASLRAACGDFAEAARLEREAAELARDDPHWARRKLVYAFARAVTEDRVEDLPELEVQAQRLFNTEWFVMREFKLGLVAQVRARLGDRRGLEATLARLPQDSWGERHEMVVGQWLAAPMVALGDLERARKLYESLRPYAGWHITCGPPFPMYGGSFALPLAILAAGLRDPDAGTWFEQAIDAARSFGALPGLAHALVAYAEYLPPGAERTRHATEALELAERMGLAELTRRARAALAAGGNGVEAPGRATPAAPAPARQEPAGSNGGLSLCRDGDMWQVRYAGAVAHFRDARGFQMLAALMSAPGREVAALVLDGAPGAPGPAGRSEADDLDGVLGGIEALDVAAVKAYRQRAADLREDLEEAEDHGDLHRAGRLREELAALEAELARAVGLGGRARKLAAPAERARINVQRRIKDAIGRIGAALPDAGRHLEATVRTGSVCVYHPR